MVRVLATRATLLLLAAAVTGWLLGVMAYFPVRFRGG